MSSRFQKHERCFELAKRIVSLCRSQLDGPITDYVSDVVDKATMPRARSQQLEIIFRLATIDPALLRCALPKLQVPNCIDTKISIIYPYLSGFHGFGEPK
jgi:hypothetical protein